MFKKTAIILSFLFVTGVGFSEAADFTINGNLDMKNMHPDVVKIHVGCTISDTPFGQPGITGDNVIAAGFQRISIPVDGNLNASYQLNFNTLPDKDPAEATDWTCSYLLMKAGGSLSSVGLDVSTSPKPGTALVERRSGTFQ